jgi:hypothetical protein
VVEQARYCISPPDTVNTPETSDINTFFSTGHPRQQAGRIFLQFTRIANLRSPTGTHQQNLQTA